jgi:hypothetical protein
MHAMPGHNGVVAAQALPSTFPLLMCEVQPNVWAAVEQTRRLTAYHHMPAQTLSS